MLLKTHMCDPQLLQKDLSGRVYIVTGANSGVGLATTEQLIRQGAHVICACRRVSAGEAVVASFAGLRGTAEVIQLDLSSMASVRRFAKEFLEKHDRLDGLVNNAGLVSQRKTTEDGFDIQFATNYLGHFLLTELLLPVLRTSAPSRIVCLTSLYHSGSRNNPVTVDLQDLNYEKRPYKPTSVYAETKLANLLHAKELARRLEGSGVTAFAAHPGWVQTSFGRQAMPGWAHRAMLIGLIPLRRLLSIITPFEGAQTTLHCLLDDDAPKKHNGAFFSQTGILYPKRENWGGGWPMESPNPNAHDAELPRKLYDVSLEIAGIGG